MNSYSYEKDDLSLIESAKGKFSKKVIERWFKPRNMRTIQCPEGHGKAVSSCGDSLEIFLEIANDEIVDAGFMANGCSTTIAVGSMAIELAIGKNIIDGLKIGANEIIEALDGLPEESRHCADLAASALKKALMDSLKIKNEPWKKAYRKFY